MIHSNQCLKMSTVSFSCGIGSGDDFRLLDDDDDEDDSQMLLITGDSGGLAASYSLLNLSLIHI